MESQNQAINIFISYAQEDEQAKNELSKHLESMRKEELIASWAYRYTKQEK